MKKSRIAEALSRIAQQQPAVVEEKRETRPEPVQRVVDHPVRRPIRWIIRRRTP